MHSDDGRPHEEPAETRTPGPGHLRAIAGFVRRHWKDITLFLITCLVVIAVEEIANYVMSGGQQSEENSASSLFELAPVYQWLLRAPDESSQSAVVMIDPNQRCTVTSAEVCRQRVTMAYLLRAIESAGASAIVIDKFYGAGTCADPQDQKFTDAFLMAARDVSRRIPVIYGLNVEQGDEGPEVTSLRLENMDVSGPKPRKAANAPAADSCPPVDGRVEKTTGLIGGIMMAEPNNRQVPLGWWVVERPSGCEGYVPSLSMQAALAVSPSAKIKLPEEGSLLAKNDEAPFIGFIGTSGFPQCKSLDVLCAFPNGAEHDPAFTCNLPRACNNRPRNEQPVAQTIRNKLNRRVVFIGELASRDKFETAVGMIPGVYLHANYFEALVGNRVLQPLPRVVEFLFSVAFFVTFVLIVLTYEHRPWMALLCVVTLLVICAGLIRVVAHFGAFLSIPTAGIIAMLIKLSNLAFCRFKLAREE